MPDKTFFGILFGVSLATALAIAAVTPQRPYRLRGVKAKSATRAFPASFFEPGRYEQGKRQK